MEIIAQNLVIVTRTSRDNGREVLVGQKQRGLFEGKDVFPGGKVESTEAHPRAAARELHEEAGLRVKPKKLREIGRLLIYGAERLGSVAIFHREVPPTVIVRNTAELLLRWARFDDPALCNTMPSDVVHWWPQAQRAIRGEDASRFIVHINEQGSSVEVIVKRPNHANDLGEMLVHHVAEAMCD